MICVSVLCSNRVSQMTKTYNDIEAVTQLLAEVSRLISYIIIQLLLLFSITIIIIMKINCFIVLGFCNFSVVNVSQFRLFLHLTERKRFGANSAYWQRTFDRQSDS